VKQVRYAPEVVSNVVTYTTIVEVKNADMKLRPGMTATVAIVVGEARNKLLVPNSALRFQPEMSPEEMREMFQALRGGTTGQQGGERPQREPGMSGSPSGGGMGGGMGSRRRDMARVWLEDENGQLSMLFIKSGVTDNVYTEVVSGDLEEGMEVITGTDSSTSPSSSNSNNAMRMMRFMR